DNADIFTDDEERAMEARIREIRKEIKKDIVIYTDVTDYGLDYDICAADFYDFNGYGYGDDYEGMILFIDMDPYNRGFFTCGTGPVSMGLHTETTANLLDDVLYEYMAAGMYTEGAANWIENIRTMYLKGSPFAPEWYPEGGKTIAFHHDASSPRVVDELGVLTEDEIDNLSSRAAQISDKYGIDVAIHLQPTPHGMDYDDVSEMYYRYMGYGKGDNYDGIILNVFKRQGFTAAVRVTAFGSVNDKLSDAERERLRSFVWDETYNAHYYKGASDWLSRVEHLEKTGRVQRSGLYWAVVSAASVIVGAIYGIVRLSLAAVKMDTPVEKKEADSYLNRNASKIRDAGKRFLYDTNSRVYDPLPKHESGGGSSSSHGGRSSYKSSYSGSSGRSHSGSGRRF
ncbi:MAG: TPM domain-containing protein, partial [Firmicutes bacterium]|nr:TPM domain-containing protein [Bacillota bacterium]